MSEERVKVLATHLNDLYDEFPLNPTSPRVFNTLAGAFLADPQAHIDALVEAGMLRPTGVDITKTRYEIVQPEPHNHGERCFT